MGSCVLAKLLKETLRNKRARRASVGSPAGVVWIALESAEAAEEVTRVCWNASARPCESLCRASVFIPVTRFTACPNWHE